MRTPVTSARTREALAHLRDESVRRLVASEKAVEREFHTARLLVSLAAGLVLVGFLLVAQWRGNATLESSLERLSDQNLAIIIQEITAENTSLRSEVMRLETRIFAAQSETKDRGEVLNEAARELRAIRLISGLDAASGPGVRITIADPQRVLLPQDFVSLVQELRAGGSEAIEVNGVRVGAMSGFSGMDGTIELDGVVLTRDFEINAVGDPASLEQAIALPGGLKSTLSTFPGVKVDILRLDVVKVSRVAEVTFEFGEPYEE